MQPPDMQREFMVPDRVGCALPTRTTTPAKPERPATFSPNKAELRVVAAAGPYPGTE